MNKIVNVIILLVCVISTPIYAGTHTFEISGVVDSCIDYGDTTVLVIDVDTNTGNDYFTVICPSNLINYCRFNSIGDIVLVEGVIVKQNSSLLIQQEMRLRSSTINTLFDARVGHLGCSN